MSTTTSPAKSFWDLVDSLSPNEDLTKLQATLEQRLHTDLASMTIPERQLLDALRLREECLAIPFYAKRDKADPQWWINFKGSSQAAIAMPRTA